jgi:probable HAF family extracellular repeat protein
MSKGRLPSLYPLITLILLACGQHEEEPRPYSFTALEFPGATLTAASGINDAGDVVGWYEKDQTMRGFVYRNGEFTTVDYPGAARTQVAGIGADGTLVGAYRWEGEPPIAFHPFTVTPTGEFVDISHPDRPYGMAQRILPDGSILGCYHGDDSTTTMFGTVLSNGVFTVLDVPGSMYSGATPDGRRTVGLLAIEGRAFIADGQRVTQLEAPGSSTTEAWDINASGTIVGVRVDHDEVAHGFVYENGRWITLSVPGARSSAAFGINAHGTIVGVSEDAEGVRRGYLASRP